jgi:opacity protein-like surface antigen
MMCAALIGASAPAAVADAPEAGASGFATPNAFSEGTVNTLFYGQSYHDFNDDITYNMGTFALEWFFADDWALGAEFSGWHVSQGLGSDTSAVGIHLAPRKYVKHYKDLSIFVEGGAGIMYAQDRTPMPNGTNFNFTLSLGAGLKWQLADNVSFFGGVRYLHLSNGNRHGDDRNPSFDGGGGFGGLQINF